MTLCSHTKVTPDDQTKDSQKVPSPDAENHAENAEYNNLEHILEENCRYMTRSKTHSPIILNQLYDYGSYVAHLTRDLEEKMKLQYPGKALRKECKLSNEVKTVNVLNCPFCNITFSDNRSFIIHVGKHNNNNRLHKCKECGKILSSASSLDRHMYVHSGERPFKCKLCPISFTTNGNMHRHMRSSHGARWSPKDDSFVPVSENNKQSKKSAPMKRKRADLETACTSDNSENDEKIAKRFAIKKRGGEVNQVFKCPVCCEMCMSLESFQLHMEIHPNDSIICPFCKTESNNYTCYKKHSCADESPQTGFKDISCRYEFSSVNFPRIAKKACEERIRCPNNSSITFKCSCGLAFPCKRSLQQHEAGHKIGTFCDACGCDFTSSEKLNIHQLLKHNCMEDYKKLKSSCSSNVEKDTFLATLGLLRNVSVKSPPKDLPQEFEFHSLHSSDFKSMETESKHECVTESSNDLADIPSIISLTSTIPCIRDSPQTSSSECSTEQTSDVPAIESTSDNSSDLLSYEYKAHSFQENSGNMKNHIETKGHLEPEEKFNCKQCQLSLPTQKDLKQHAKSHSQSGQSHQCTFCSYQSADRSTLTRHMLTHNGERPFKCSLCDYAFTTKANSLRHVKKKHKLPDNQVADAVIYNPNMLESGISPNAPNDSNSTETVCKYCNKDFKNNRVLRHHLRSVSNSCNNKPFLCQKCNLGFSTKNNCIRHISKQHPEYKEKLKELIVINVPSPPPQDEMGEINYIEAFEEKQITEEIHNVETENFSSEILQFEKELELQNSCSEDDRVIAAKSLVGLSETLVYQELPLDLSLRAVDLSSKSAIPNKFSEQSFSSPASRSLNKVSSKTDYVPTNIQPAHSSPFMTRFHLTNSSLNLVSSKVDDAPINNQPAHCSPFITRFPETASFGQHIYSPMKIPQNDLSQNSMYNFSSVSPPPLMCLAQNLSAIPAIMVDSTCLFVPNISLPVESNNVNCENTSDLIKDKLKLQSNSKSKVKCDYCDASFTLKSNKERHIKKKHREYARPARSRNYIPSLLNDSLKPNTSTLSDKTRDALRGVLNIKANNTTKCYPDNRNNNTVLNLALRKEECILNGNLMESKDDEMKNNLDVDIENGPENIDLASVSSVISTANSQIFQQYLKEAKNCDLITHGTNIPVLSKRKYDYKEKMYVSSDDENVKKESSYSKHKKSIQCKYCNKTFPWESSFQRHLLTHTGDKPYSCKNCDQEFTTKSNCNRHVFKSHVLTDVIAKDKVENKHKCRSQAFRERHFSM